MNSQPPAWRQIALLLLLQLSILLISPCSWCVFFPPMCSPIEACSRLESSANWDDDFEFGQEINAKEIKWQGE
jgi:hypothetical protein